MSRLRQQIAAFEAGGVDVPTIQSHLQTAMDLLERDAAASAQRVRAAEGDLELIQHTSLLGEHRDRALNRLRELDEQLAYG